jgi:hypothetical protein
VSRVGAADRMRRPEGRPRRARQYVQDDLEADREVATILVDRIVGGVLVTEVAAQADEPDQADET